MLYEKFQSNISSGSVEKNAFSGLAIFCISSHFLILDQAEFYHSKALQLVMLHVKFENYGCNGFRE